MPAHSTHFSWAALRTSAGGAAGALETFLYLFCSHLHADRYCGAVVRRKGFVRCLMPFTLLPFPSFFIEWDESLKPNAVNCNFKSVLSMSRVSAMLAVLSFVFGV